MRVISVAALIFVLAVVGAGVGCGGKGGGGAARMMDIIPQDTSDFG